MPHSNLAQCDDRQRLHLLACTRLLDTEASEAFDRITRLAADIFGAPIALVSLVDERRQWFKSRYGLDIQETDRRYSFCTHAIEHGDLMVIEDAAQDERFTENPLVFGEAQFRFYAGAPLILESGPALGTLCVIDHRPRTFSAGDRQRLASLASLVVAQIDLHQRTGRIDGVTRLPNRAQMTDDLQSLCRAFPGEPRVLMLVDVMAHAQLQAAVRAVGIRPLEGTMREIAAKLRASLPTSAALYHVAETRFSFLLPGTSRDEHDRAASALLGSLREPFTSGGISVELETQAGLVDFSLLAEEAADVLRKATSAMHESVSLGKSYLWHGACFDAAHRRAYSLLRDVQAGLRRGEFRLMYQPKLNLRTGKYSGVEALARWNHPQHGNISPAEFIPLIESTMLIHEFTRWVLHAATAQWRLWREAGIDIAVAVNVSSRNLEESGFLATVTSACQSSGIDPAKLHIECTEHSVMTSAATQSALEALRALGVQISLDDFGMGFSNLSCLSSLPVNLLKIDRSLITPIVTQSRALQLVRSLIALGHDLGYRMLAEGVETQAELDLLVAADCDAVQGFFLCRPLESSALSEFLLAGAGAATHLQTSDACSE